MVKVTYLGPGFEARLKLKRAYLDLVPEIDRCKPLGPEYEALTGLCGHIRETYRALFNEDIRPVAGHASCGPGIAGVTGLGGRPADQV